MLGIAAVSNNQSLCLSLSTDTLGNSERCTNGYPCRVSAGFARLSKSIISLGQPENLTKIGVASLASLSSRALIFNGIAAFSLAIGEATMATAFAVNGVAAHHLIFGATLTCTGLITGMLKTAWAAEKNFKWKAVRSYLVEQKSQIINTFAISFFLSLIIENFHALARIAQVVPNDFLNRSNLFEAQNRYMERKYPGISFTRDNTGNFESFYKIIGWEDVPIQMDSDSSILGFFSEVVSIPIKEWFSNIDVSDFTAPSKVVLSKAYRLSDTMMNVLVGVSACWFNRNKQDEKAPFSKIRLC